MDILPAGIMVTQVVSNKADGKECTMEEKRRTGRETGRYLAGGRCPMGHTGKWLMVTVLLAWDGLLFYMLIRCLIEPVYGAVFVAGVSFYLGNLL